MSTKHVTSYSCDNPIRPCEMERTRTQIDAERPWFRVEVHVTAITPAGDVEVMNEAGDFCYWDRSVLWTQMSDAMEQYIKDLRARLAEEAATAPEA